MHTHTKKEKKKHNTHTQIRKPSCKICCCSKAWKSDHLCSGSSWGAAAQRRIDLDIQVLEPLSRSAFHDSGHNNRLPELSEHGTNRRHQGLKVPVSRTDLLSTMTSDQSIEFFLCFAQMYLIANCPHPPSNQTYPSINIWTGMTYIYWHVCLAH